MSLSYLTYVSSASAPMSDEMLVELLEQSRDNNTALNITGMLMFFDGNFIQLLEGEQDSIKSIYSAVCKDTRNRGVIMLENEPLKSRNCPDWSMGFVSSSNLAPQTLKGYLQVDENPFT